MAQESERPGVTEMHVRMNCNGCVHRIKKALHGVQGVYEVHVDFALQKLTVVGKASPEKIVKAIKKTRRIATVCSHTEAGAPEQPPAEPAPSSSDPPAPDAANQPPAEAPPAEAAEQTKEEPPVPEDAAGVVKPSPEAVDAAANQPEGLPSEACKDVGEIHMMHQYYPHYHAHQDQWSGYHSYGYGVQYEEPHVIHSYSRYRQSGNTSEYGFLRPAPQSYRHTVTEPYIDDYYRSSRSNEGNNITSMFSDENPNACTIV